LLKPFEEDGGVETTGVGEDDFLFHSNWGDRIYGILDRLTEIIFETKGRRNKWDEALIS
jgi:hypothetical protein